MLRNNLQERGYVKLGDIVDFIPEKTSSNGSQKKIKASEIYHYVELQDINFGDFNYKELRGWQLPSRARHFAEEGDIYFGSIWGSVAKWCYMEVVTIMLLLQMAAIDAVLNRKRKFPFRYCWLILILKGGLYKCERSQEVPMV